MGLEIDILYMQATTVQKQFKNQKFRKGNKILPKWDIKIAFQWVPWEKKL